MTFCSIVLVWVVNVTSSYIEFKVNDAMVTMSQRLLKSAENNFDSDVFIIPKYDI